MKKPIRISASLAMPMEAATESFAVIGRRGSGKTHTAVVMAEELCRVDVQVVVIDPTDAWWGLRTSRDGSGPGIPIYVFGGSHADAPLAEESGAVMADAVVDCGISVVLSVRHLSKAGQRRFVAAFCDRIYERKGEPDKHTPVHVFIDEADIFVPQRLVPGSERCFAAVDEIVRRGRNSGLAATLISQRPQVINKDVLSQTEVLVAHQLTGPQDRAALKTWIEAHDAHDRRDEFMRSLASLPKGTAWVWSPGMLDVFERVEIRDRRTFDSSFTPKPGMKARKARVFAKVDLENLTAAIAGSIEQAKANDPRELRRRIAELERQLSQTREKPEPTSTRLDARSRKTLARAVKMVRSAKDSAMRSAEQWEAIHTTLTWLETHGTVTPAALDTLSNRDEGAREPRTVWSGPFQVELSAASFTPRNETGRTTTPRPHHRPDAGDVEEPKWDVDRVERDKDGRVTGLRANMRRTKEPGDGALREIPPSLTGNLPEGERKMLTAIAQYRGEGIDRNALSVLTGYKRSSRDTYLGRLRQRQAIQDVGTNLRVTSTGLALLGPSFQPLPTGKRLREYWLERLPEGEARILTELIRQFPDPVARETLSDVTGYKRSSRDTYIGRLAARQLVIRTGEGVSAARTLFDSEEGA